MKAVIGDTVLAEAPQEDLVKVEGNWYFPPASIVDGVLEKTATAYHCPWKGDAQYFAVKNGGESLPDRAFSYPHLLPGATERVGKDFGGYVAFWKEVTVVD